MRKFWTDDKIDELIKYYPIESRESLEKRFSGVVWSSIQTQASKLKITRMNYYTEEEIKYILDNCYSLKSEEIAKKLGRTSGAIEKKARELGIVKQVEWSKSEEDFLIKNFSNMTLDEISKKIGRSVSSLYHKIQELNMQKKTKRYDLTREQLAEMLKNVSDRLGRTPNTKELFKQGLPTERLFIKLFGSYSEACKAVGIEENQGMLSNKKCFSKGGIFCLSTSEQVITNYLEDLGISFLKDYKYSEIVDDDDCGRMTCDWYLTDRGIIVEFFGIPKNKKYKEKMERKIQLCKRNNLKLVEIFYEDLPKLKNFFV